MDEHWTLAYAVCWHSVMQVKIWEWSHSCVDRRPTLTLDEIRLTLSIINRPAAAYMLLHCRSCRQNSWSFCGRSLKTPTCRVYSGRLQFSTLPATWFTHSTSALSKALLQFDFYLFYLPEMVFKTFLLTVSAQNLSLWWAFCPLTTLTTASTIEVWPCGYIEMWLYVTVITIITVIIRYGDIRYGESVDDTVEENSSVLSLIRMQWLPLARACRQ